MARWRNRSPHEAGEASGEKGKNKTFYHTIYTQSQKTNAVIINIIKKHKFSDSPIFLFCALALLENHAEIFCGIVFVKAICFN